MTNTPIPDFARVVLSDDPQYMTIWFHWALPGSGLDRPSSHGISCLPRHIPRLARAFLEGALFDQVKTMTDVNGHTYAGGRCKVYGKRINRDLLDLGY